ncbi:MAG: DNA/RNA non-specific endonuclease [Bacteroidales bacterium]|nr:DNA/RNA non-specific endonuclease [Bacteroidales bacterium]
MKGLRFVLLLSFLSLLLFSCNFKHAGAENEQPVQDSLLEVKISENICEQILERKAYIVSYNKDNKIPNWVGWKLTKEHTNGDVKRPTYAFHEDEQTPKPRATVGDYMNSGWSRGHMFPAGDSKWDKDAMYESFLFSNICPQDAKLNSGRWNDIEILCRKWARKYGEIYIICGPVFYNQEHETIGKNELVVPEAFFKVVLCMNPVPMGIGFICKNSDGKNPREFYVNSIDEVERITGFDFFYNLPDDIENQVETEKDLNKW